MQPPITLITVTPEAAVGAARVVFVEPGVIDNVDKAASIIDWAAARRSTSS